MSANPPAAPSPRSRRRIRWIPLAVLAVAAIVVAVLVVVGGSCVSVRIPKSGSRQTVIFYSMPTDLRPGARMTIDDLQDRLETLDYQEVEDPLLPGQYRISSGGVAEIFLRPIRYPDRAFQGGRVRLRIRGGTISSADPLSDVDMNDLRLDPVRIAGYQGEIGAVLDPLRLEEAPQLLRKAVVAIEDHRFYQHPGIDPIGTARAFIADIRHKETAQGGSTLTQQLARSLYLHNKKTVLRKLQEAVIAVGLELRYSKDEILEGYLNAIYLGYWGPMEIRGVREASRYYLGCEIEDADPAGIALLVGLIQAPNAYSPYNSPEKARARRNLVLRLLREKGILTEAEARKGMAEALPSKRPPVRSVEAAYFLDAARDEVERRASKGILDRPGTAIFTTLDPHDQAAAVAAIQQGIQDLERDHRGLRRRKEPLQAAIVSVDPATGEVRALVGGRDYLQSPFNRAVDARRQPGSLFKPFVYLAAFSHPRRSDDSYWTPATILQDEPIEIRAGRKVWRPQNYDREFRGEVTVRQALEQSLNVPTASVGKEVGIRYVAEAAHALGVASPLDEVPSLALGTSDVTLLEMTEAYAALADGGEAHTPTFLIGIVSDDGRPVPLTPLTNPPGCDQAVAFLVTNLLEGVIDSGTGRSARSLGVRGVAAGKTGTTDDYRDAWFVGYTPRCATGVWVGFDRRAEIGLSGAAAALPIWAAMMRQNHGDGGDGDFRAPPGVVHVTVCAQSGLLATGDCPDYHDEIFLEGTEPDKECDLHGGGILGSIRRFFRL